MYNNTLTVSQVIDALEDVLNKKGDIPFYVSANDSNKHVFEVDEIHCIKVSKGVAILKHTDEDLDIDEIEEDEDDYVEADEETQSFDDVKDFFGDEDE